jgi:hypothetical protein
MPRSMLPSITPVPKFLRQKPERNSSAIATNLDNAGVVGRWDSLSPSVPPNVLSPRRLWAVLRIIDRGSCWRPPRAFLIQQLAISLQR